MGERSRCVLPRRVVVVTRNVLDEALRRCAGGVFMEANRPQVLQITILLNMGVLGHLFVMLQPILAPVLQLIVLDAMQHGDCFHARLLEEYISLGAKERRGDERPCLASALRIGGDGIRKALVSNPQRQLVGHGRIPDRPGKLLEGCREVFVLLVVKERIRRVGDSDGGRQQGERNDSPPHADLHGIFPRFIADFLQLIAFLRQRVVLEVLSRRHGMRR
mmetsp:Transcript_2278/g.5923  ORF Transcript_2278/g.5923 Transcript_2278/m.5923 type:complete len:219 (-) Transcript_2278:175-831(-)